MKKYHIYKVKEYNVLSKKERKSILQGNSMNRGRNPPIILRRKEEGSNLL
jgi:hypothetical protein